MIKVSDALKLEALKGCKVVGGSKGLDRMISSVNQMDAPDFVNWTKENQFIVTTGYFIRNDINEQKQIILDLNEKKCAGLGIKVKRFFRTIPQHMIELADQEGLPLIEIPFEDNIAEIMNEMMKEILVCQTRKIERSHQIHDRFTKLALKGGGLNEIAELLSSFVNNSISISDNNWKSLSLFNHPQAKIALSKLLIFETPADNRIMQEVINGEKKYIEDKIFLEDKEIKRIIYPVMSEKKLYGHITIWENVEELEEVDIVAIEHAATVVGLELLKSTAFSEMRKRLKADFFADYLAGNIKSREVLAIRGTAYGINSNSSYICMVLDVDHFTRIYLEEMDGSDIRAAQLKRKLSSLVDEVLANNNLKAVTFNQSDQIVIILQHNPREKSREITKHLAFEIKAHIYKNISGLTVTIGVGTIKDALLVHQSYSNAVEAIKIGAKLQQKNDCLLYFEDLFVEHLLNMLEKEKLKEIYSESIEKLVLFDKDNKMDLVKTLEIYFHCNYNLTEASKEMFIHRNTFTYRLEKIKEILDTDLNDYNVLLKLQLALKLKGLLMHEAD
ncbi:MAG: PucR family transcriptional regulator [Bacillota bacterium]